MHMDEWINNMHQFTNLIQKEFNFHIDIFFLHKIDYYQLKECHLKWTIIGHKPNEIVKVCKSWMKKCCKSYWKGAAKVAEKVLLQTEKGVWKRADAVWKNGQTGRSNCARPVQPVLDTGSTGFSQGVSWWIPAELKFNSEVQLVSPAELESSAGQTSWAWNENFKIIFHNKPHFKF